MVPYFDGMFQIWYAKNMVRECNVRQAIYGNSTTQPTQMVKEV